MTCKCTELKEFNFRLNLDIEKLHDRKLTDIFNNNEELIKIGSRTWVSESVERSGYIYEWLAVFENAVNEVKSELCPCFQNKMDTVKFVILDLTHPTMKKHLLASGYVSPGYNVITINYFMLGPLAGDPWDSYRYDAMKGTIYHELIHVFESCPPCKDKQIIKFVSDQFNQLYTEYKNFKKDIDQFNKSFIENILKEILSHKDDDNLSFCELTFITYLESGAFKFIDSSRFDYAATNAAEFLATMSAELCRRFLGVWNPTLSESFDSIPNTCKDHIVTRFQNIKNLYIRELNQKFKDLQTRLCNIWDKIYPSSDNCNESFTNNIYEISFYPTARDKDYCVKTYQVELKPKNTGCCKQESNDITTSKFTIGQISRQNECDCDFLWTRIEYQADQLLDNCLRPTGNRLYFTGDQINLIIDIENQVVDAINSKYAGKIKIIRDLSEKSTPCSK